MRLLLIEDEKKVADFVARGLPGGGRVPMVRVGDLAINRQTQHVTRSGKRIELTAKEYGLLEYLASNAGRVISRTMIVEHVWDESF